MVMVIYLTPIVWCFLVWVQVCNCISCCLIAPMRLWLVLNIFPSRFRLLKAGFASGTFACQLRQAAVGVPLACSKIQTLDYIPALMIFRVPSAACFARPLPEPSDLSIGNCLKGCQISTVLWAFGAAGCWQHVFRLLIHHYFCLSSCHWTVPSGTVLAFWRLSATIWGQNTSWRWD